MSSREGGSDLVRAHAPARKQTRRRLRRKTKRSHIRLWLSVGACAILGAVMAAPAHGAAGDLDPSFGGGDGKVVTPTDLSNFVGGMVLQTDQKIVAVGASGNDFLVRRYETDGDLDPTFGVGGTVAVDFSGRTDAAYDVAVQPDSKIVVVGGSGGDFAVARFNGDGSLDTSFDGDSGTGNGIVTTAVGCSTSASDFDEAHAVAIQPDGKIVVAGVADNAICGGPGTSFEDFAVVRYNSDGTLDTTFSGDGVAFASNDFDEGWGVVLQPDGKIVVAGKTGPIADSMLARFNANGSLDTTFNDADGSTQPGVVVTAIGPSVQDDLFRGLALQADGKIVAAGFVETAITGNDFALVRYNTDGSLDPSFDGDGKVETDFGALDVAYAVAIQADGKIVAAGETGDGSGSGNFALARYNTDGSLDPSFDGDGKVETDFGALDRAYAVAIQADGKLVAFGLSTSPEAFLLARYFGFGAPDTLTLSPLAATNTVGTTHAVTATVTNASGEPVQGITVRFTVTGANPLAVIACTTAANGQCTVTYIGTQAGGDVISAYADTDGDNVNDFPGEAQGEATKTWIPPTLVLTPPTASNTVGTSHAVTATVTNAAGQPVQGVTVRFTVTGANPLFVIACTTGANGQCTFTYIGTQAGEDVISAYADTDGDNVNDFPGEAQGEATKTWTPPTSGCPVNGGDDDEDNDGLEDKDEHLLGTLLGVADSDGDGRKDGNDDSDDDGEDDEDEDDDTDDECPNDSDGDGEDDEDEDDDEDD